jgi:hypothetical protein
MPSSSTANITVTVDSKCLHYLIFHGKIQQSVYRMVVPSAVPEIVVSLLYRL